MGRLAKHFPTFARAVKWVLARYEAAYQSWGERSLLWSTFQDARIDASEATRKELCRIHNHLVQNNGIIQRIRNLKIQFTAGVEGLQVTPNSSDEDWNESRAASYNRWCKRPELTTNLSMGQLHIQWAGALFDHGEVFIHKTSNSGNRQNPSDPIEPKIETIAANRVQTPPDQREREGKDIFDGIRVDSIGRKISYFVRRAFDNKIYDEVPADEMIHVYKVRHPGMLRGLPEGYSVYNNARDLMDLHRLEMMAAKSGGKNANVIKNAAGQANAGALRRSALQISTQDSAGNSVVKRDDQFWNVTLGGETIYLKPGEELMQFKNERPSVVTQQYWDGVVSLICCGYNTPKLLVLPYSLQGTVTRADLDVCAGAFRTDFEILAAAVREIYEWQTTWAVDYDRTMDGDTPDDFLESIIRPPRAPNVDIGRNAAALALELKIGTVTYQDVFAERQKNWRDEFRQAAEAAAFLQDLAKEFSVNGRVVTVDNIAQKLELKVTDPAQPKDKPLEEVAA